MGALSGLVGLWAVRWVRLVASWFGAVMVLGVCASSALAWESVYPGPVHATDGARSIALSPDGSLVFVTGVSPGSGTGNDYATIAYSASTGARVWLRRYNGPGNGDDHPVAIAVSPDGSEVFVTGSSVGSGSGNDYATIAYRASTGALLWLRRYNGPGNGDDHVTGLAVSPSGAQVFVTGASYGGAVLGNDFATVAYNAVTGALEWQQRYVGPGSDENAASAIVATPDGSEVVVTGTSTVSSTEADYLTVAYAPATGAKLWSRRYTGGVGVASPRTAAAAIAANPNSSAVYVTGTTVDSKGTEYGTVAYNASTGAQLWAGNRLNPGGPVGGLAIVANSTQVFATGGSDLTEALSTSNGALLWYESTSNGITGENRALALSPDGTTLWVVGDKVEGHLVWSIWNFLTSDGTAMGTSGLASTTDSSAYGVAVAPDSKTAYITGANTGFDGFDYFTTLSCKAPHCGV